MCLDHMKNENKRFCIVRISDDICVGETYFTKYPNDNDEIFYIEVDLNTEETFVNKKYNRETKIFEQTDIIKAEMPSNQEIEFAEYILQNEERFERIEKELKRDVE